MMKYVLIVERDSHQIMYPIITKKKCLGLVVEMKLAVGNGSINFVFKCQMKTIKNIHKMIKNGFVISAENNRELKIILILKVQFEKIINDR